MLKPEHRIAILLHGGILGRDGKTGLAVARYSESEIVAIIDRESVGRSLVELTRIDRRVPIVASVEDALACRPDVLLIGIAPSGGKLPDAWMGEIERAVAAGVSVANGLHQPMADDPRWRNQLQPGQWIWDIRQEPPNLPIASAKARSLSCLRVLAVGTDMAVGKMSASLEIDRAARRRGVRSQFLATGQAGLMISGTGIALDAVRVDFAAGAVEQLVTNAGDDRELLVVEGQGSLLHPGSTATLPLMRGAQPTHLVLVHRTGQTAIARLPHIEIPPLPQVVQLYETVAGVAGYPGKVAAVALNTFHYDEERAREEIAAVEAETGLPCTDAVRFGADRIVDAIESDRP
ncbi:MAG: DUF1611 domain-containing protein [Cyanobacteriota bacterium]|nr:DUF1611 domain-containing protein [Cyanobacteriota bacterium]